MLQKFDEIVCMKRVNTLVAIVSFGIIFGFLSQSAEAKKLKTKKSAKHHLVHKKSKKNHKPHKKHAKHLKRSATEQSSASYCSNVADEVLALNGMGSFYNPRGKKMKLSKGVGYRFSNRSMKAVEGVFVYSKAKRNQIEVVKLEPGEKSPSRTWLEVDQRCKISKIWGNYKSKEPKVAVTRRSCQLVSQDLERSPASAYPISKLTFQDKTPSGRKKVQKKWRALQRAGVKGPFGSFEKVKELCSGYGEVFPGWKPAESSYEVGGDRAPESTYEQPSEPISDSNPAPELSEPTLSSLPEEPSVAPELPGSSADVREPASSNSTPQTYGPQL